MPNSQPMSTCSSNGGEGWMRLNIIDKRCCDEVMVMCCRAGEICALYYYYENDSYFCRAGASSCLPAAACWRLADGCRARGCSCACRQGKVEIFIIHLYASLLSVASYIFYYTSRCSGKQTRFARLVVDSMVKVVCELLFGHFLVQSFKNHVFFLQLTHSRTPFCMYRTVFKVLSGRKLNIGPFPLTFSYRSVENPEFPIHSTHSRTFVCMYLTLLKVLSGLRPNNDPFPATFSYKNAKNNELS